jgi:hypothetical protein
MNRSFALIVVVLSACAPLTSEMVAVSPTETQVAAGDSSASARKAAARSAPASPAKAAEPAATATAPSTAPPLAPVPTPTVAHLSNEQARAQYDLQYIDFHEWKTIRNTEPYQGRFVSYLSWPDFYAKVGRPDLAARSQSRHTLGKAILGAGIALSIGSTISIAAQVGANSSCLPPGCATGVAGYAIGAAMWVVGLAGTIGGPFVQTRVTSSAEARQLGAEHNWRLRQSLLLQ